MSLWAIRRDRKGLHADLTGLLGALARVRLEGHPSGLVVGEIEGDFEGSHLSTGLTLEAVLRGVDW